MISVEPSLEQLAPSDKLAMSHDQVSETVEQLESSSSSSSSSSDQEEEIENYTFEPLIAGDFPTSIRKQATPKKEDQDKKNNKKEKLDLSSESAFPSLSSSNSSASTAAAVSCWSSTASRVKTQPTQPIKSTTTSNTSSSNVKRGATKVTQVTDVLEITGDKQIANHPEKPENFKGNTQIIQEVMSRTNTNIIASTKLSGTSTYLIQGASKDVARAKYELIANITIKSS